MSYHIVNIDAPTASISCRKGQLTCKADGVERSVPLEDVAAIVITSFSATVHSKLLLEAAKHGVGLIICEAFEPVSLLLPANRSSDTLLTKATLNLDKKKIAGLWRKTIDAKCRNQHTLAHALAPEHPKLERLKATAYGKSEHKEATCARFYWQIIGEALADASCQRGRNAGGLNDLLNFGYAVLLSSTLQKLFAYGLDPTFGIGHAVRERSAPLAYDIMEPFRPCVDARVAQWVKEKAAFQDYRITKEFRQWVTGFILEKVGYLDIELEVHHCLEGVVRSFRSAVLKQTIREYKPWIGENSKWAGCLSLSTSR